MKFLKGIMFMLRSRGLAKGFKRLFFILERFGVTPRKHIRCLNHYIAILKKYNIKATFFIPALIVNKYAGDIKTLDSAVIEWGIHADVHTDLSRLDKQTQEEHIKKAIQTFDRLGIVFSGFRAPYLKTNNNTQAVLAGQHRFEYDSSKTVLWDDIYGPGNSSYGWASMFYKFEKSTLNTVMPYKKDGILEIPVSLPDDDMLFDRDKLTVKQTGDIWIKMLKVCVRRNELFVLQLHPERIFEAEEALSRLISEAQRSDPPVLITTLRDIANLFNDNKLADKVWPEPYRAGLCISGDIDSLTLLDFVDRLKKW